jgi:NAD+ synthase (glutamine-hydrolysing)
MRIAMAQFDFAVGAARANADRGVALAPEARDRHGARLCLFPELALSGYLAEDLFLRPGFVAECADALASLVSRVSGIDVVVGHPLAEGDRLYNALSWIRDGRIVATYRKQALPNYTVFDEKRYFDPGAASLVVELDGIRFGTLICEDIWEDGPSDRAVRAGAEVLLVINASPFDPLNRERRFALVRERAAAHGVALAYVNTVGGQDDLVFDGASVAVDADGTLVGPAASLEDTLLCLDYDRAARRFSACDWRRDEPSRDALLYRCLVRATRDYVAKNGFPGVLIGLSGGVDSALTLAIAVDALGAERVEAVAMPSRYTSALSNDEAAAQARLLGVRHRVVPIEPAFQAFVASLAPSFEGRAADVTEENLQARCRGVILMALSNKLRHMVLTTGNKSEMAVGYATLYGDMCGGFAPLKDCYKTVVYALCRYRNAISPAIPEAVIERPPSAELRPGQTDQDSLPPYEMLDAILERFIERDESAGEIVAAGYERAVVERVLSLVVRSEYKRRQSAPGPRVTTRAFGRDRRYPISSGWGGGAA